MGKIKKNLVNDMYSSIFLVALALAAAQAGWLDPGPCPKAVPLAEFDANKFSGDWYMISFKPNMMESATLRCRKMSFEVSDKTKIIMTSTDMDGDQKRTAQRTATWNPENGGVMAMAPRLAASRFSECTSRWSGSGAVSKPSMPTSR